MFLTYLAPFCIIVGALVYALASNPKASELGRLLFAAAVLATLLAIGMTHAIRF